MSISSQRLLVAVAAATLGAALAAGSAHAFQVPTPPPWAICAGNTSANEAVLVASLSPAENATVPAGTPLTFSGSSSAPLTFAVASSPALLANPDIDQGAGEAQPATGTSPTYTFTSTAATAKPGTIYWSASFSNAALPECAGLTPSIYTTPARTLIVAPAPGSQPTAPEAPAPAPQTSPAPLRATLQTAGGSLDGRHPFAAYRVHCSAGCSGSISCRAFTLERHHRTPSAPALDLSSTAVSIPAPGGEQRVMHRYKGTALHALRQIARAGGQLELHCALSVTAGSGASPVKSTAWLRP